MEISVKYILIAVLYVQCLVGFTVNLAIVAANFVKWKSLRSLPTVDKILSSLGISRALYFWSFIVRNFIYNFFPWLLQKNMVKLTLYSQTMFMFYTSQWLATLLGIFYCVRIVTYNHKLIIFMKTRISTLVPRLILASLIVSLISSLPYAWYVYDLGSQGFSNGSTENETEHRLAISTNYKNRILIFSLGTVPPFVIFCAANILLIHFLLIHTRRMRSNESHVQTPDLKSHFGAMKSMSLLLLLQIIFFICMSLFASGTLLPLYSLHVIRWLILCSLPLLHSLYMISSSREVRKMFASMCLNLIQSS